MGDSIGERVFPVRTLPFQERNGFLPLVTQFVGKSLHKIRPSRNSGVSIARELALRVLRMVRSGRHAETALNSVLQAENPSPEDRRLVTELIYGVLRWRSRLDSVIDRCLNKPGKKLHPLVLEILRVAVYQIIFLDRIPYHAVVHQAVTQVKNRLGIRVSAFANALLMKVLQKKDALDPFPCRESDSLATYYSHPEWLVQRWLRDFGYDASRRMLIANNSRSPLVFRVNRIRILPDELFAFLMNHGIEAIPTFPEPDAFAIPDAGGPVWLIPGYEEGLFTVQESSSQLIAPLVGALAGERILDACAAPGGKTSYIAALVQNNARIVATDSNMIRLKETEQNLNRLGVVCVEFRLGDVTNRPFVLSLGTFDRILVDAPCSNLGVLRHNPEVKYRIREQDLGFFSQTQLRILKIVSNALRPGGKLVYSVCTTSREETTRVVTEFLEKSPEYEIEPIKDHEVHSIGFVGGDGFMRTFPPTGQKLVDGFFAARVMKSRKMCE